jgi:hypothetical protein
MYILYHKFFKKSNGFFDGVILLENSKNQIGRCRPKRFLVFLKDQVLPLSH